MTNEEKQREEVTAKLAEAMKGRPIEEIAHHMVGSFIASKGNLNQSKADFIMFLEAFKARLLQDYQIDGSRHRHIGRGSSYVKVVAKASVQSSRPIVETDVITVYISEDDGTAWARLVTEFEDGRFEEFN